MHKTITAQLNLKKEMSNSSVVEPVVQQDVSEEDKKKAIYSLECEIKNDTYRITSLQKDIEANKKKLEIIKSADTTKAKEGYALKFVRIREGTDRSEDSNLFDDDNERDDYVNLHMVGKEEWEVPNEIFFYSTLERAMEELARVKKNIQNMKIGCVLRRVRFQESLSPIVKWDIPHSFNTGRHIDEAYCLKIVRLVLTEEAQKEMKSYKRLPKDAPVLYQVNIFHIRNAAALFGEASMRQLKFIDTFPIVETFDNTAGFWHEFSDKKPLVDDDFNKLKADLATALNIIINGKEVVDTSKKRKAEEISDADDDDKDDDEDNDDY